MEILGIGAPELVFILLIAVAIATDPPPPVGTVIIALIAVYLLVALFVFAHFFGWRPALKGIGAVTLIFVTAAWLISRIW